MESGWSHFEAREYDPVIGRWLVPDPARQFSSPYNGMGNNPIKAVDPDGRKIKTTFRTGFLGIFGPKQTLTYDNQNGQWLDQNGSAYTGKIRNFQVNLLSDLNTLSADKDAGSMINYLSSDSRVLSINRGGDFFNGPKAVLGVFELSVSGNGPSSSYNQNGDPTPIPSFVTLGHEMQHAYQFMKFGDGLFRQQWYQGPNGTPITNAEIPATHLENQIRANNKLPLREFYEPGNSASRIIHQNTRQSVYFHFTY